MTQIRMLFDPSTLAQRVDQLAAEIAREVEGEVSLIGLLKGCFVFVADLVRALDRHGLRPRVDFMQVSSYGVSKQSSGSVRLVGPVPDVTGRTVLLVDDIEDTGRSLAFARKQLEQAGAKAVRSVVLLDKPARREVGFAADHVGFKIEDLFVVGYGIDYAERYRHLPYVGTVD